MLLWELEQVRVRFGSGGRIQERVLIDTGTGTEVGTAAGAGASCPDKSADCRALGVVGWHLNHSRMQIAGTTPKSLFMFPSMKYLVGYVAEQVTCRIRPRKY